MSKVNSSRQIVSYDHLWRSLNVSEEAVGLCRSCLFLDLHIDTLIPPRLWGYDILSVNRPILGGRFFGHLDVPRMEAVGLDAAMWSITTNPFRRAAQRYRTFKRNVNVLSTLVDQNSHRLRWVRNADELRGEGIGILLSIQGGNALECAPKDLWEFLDGRLTRVTLVHLTNSAFGSSNAPVHFLRRNKGLTHRGHEFVETLNANRVFVDLSHIHPSGFWDALGTHDNSLPPIVTHTGVQGVCAHWRNIDDKQIKAIADRGGVVGVMAHAGFLRRPGGPNNIDMIVEHIEHVLKVGGVECCAIGTDFDGFIIPPIGFRDGVLYPRLVQRLLDRGHSDRVISGILGTNFQASFARLRPSSMPT